MSIDPQWNEVFQKQSISIFIYNYYQSSDVIRELEEKISGLADELQGLKSKKKGG